MDSIVQFFSQYGLHLTLIAVLGIAILGTMKYRNLFTSIDENVRHVVYLAISIGLSLAGSAIYLLCIKAFELKAFITFAASVYALNQMWYNIFKVTSFNKLIRDMLEKLSELINY